MNNGIEAPITTTAERLKEALEHRHMTAAELCRRSGISSASMSQYMTGKVKPKQDRIYILALHLRVRPAWLMGYDIEPGYNNIPSSRQRERQRSIMKDNTVPPEVLNQEFGQLDYDIPEYQKYDRLSKIKRMYMSVDAETQINMLTRVTELYDLYQFKKEHT